MKAILLRPPRGMVGRRIPDPPPRLPLLACVLGVVAKWVEVWA